jgi:hypothetical protein
MASAVTLVRASTFFTLDDDTDITDGETLVIGGKTYTFQDTLTNVDGNVHIGADIQGTIANAVAAINLSNEGESAVGAGTDYAAAMTRNGSVFAVESADTLTVIAQVPGQIGNHIPVTVGTSAGAVDNATLEAGSGSIAAYLASVRELTEIGSELMTHFRFLSPETD